MILPRMNINCEPRPIVTSNVAILTNARVSTLCQQHKANTLWSTRRQEWVCNVGKDDAAIICKGLCWPAEAGTACKHFKLAAGCWSGNSSKEIQRPSGTHRRYAFEFWIFGHIVSGCTPNAHVQLMVRQLLSNSEHYHSKLYWA